MKRVIPLRGLNTGGLITPRSRGHRPSSAAIAYSLALSVLRREPEAELVAINSLRKGSHSRICVIAHARSQSLQRLGEFVITPPEELAANEVRDLAIQLTGTRPGLERAIVDLELRYSLDANNFARALGVSTERALELSKNIAATWAEELDPAMLAWLGPGSCSELQTILVEHGVAQESDQSRPDMSIGELLGVVPSVSLHATSCTACTERVRMMVSVRNVVSQLPIETVPSLVAKAAHSSKRRLPNPLPPSIEPKRIDLSRTRSLVMSGSAIALVALSGIVGVTLVADRNDDQQKNRVAQLVKSAPASQLLGTPSIITPKTTTAAIANNGNEVILWHATSSAPWLTLEPSRGRLGPAQHVTLAVKKLESSMNDKEDVVVTINGSDGSVQVLRYEPDE